MFHFEAADISFLTVCLKDERIRVCWYSGEVIYLKGLTSRERLGCPMIRLPKAEGSDVVVECSGKQKPSVYKYIYMIAF